jgi:hypothetical protein
MTWEKQIKSLKIYGQVDWKFGLITRSVVRISEKRYEIHDTSGTWVSAIVTLPTMLKLLSGEKDLLSLNWK